MTVPESYQFTEVPEELENTEDILKFLKDFRDDVSDQYSKLAEGINGSYQWNDGPASEKFEPRVSGTSTEGTGTYSSQYGWSFRQGVICDVWVDVTWTNHTGTGNLFIEMPYESSAVSGRPFVCPIQADSITVAGDNLVGNVIPGTLRLEIWENVSGGDSVNIALPSAGRIMAHVRYITRDEEQGKAI